MESITESSTVMRWIKFNSVGALGIIVQMVTLSLLTAAAGLQYLVATGLAVEVAVLHNFFWHERWTWAGRSDLHGLAYRLLCFHLTNGALSMAGNIALMALLSGKLHLNYLAANACAISVCSIFNFLAGDRIVFKKTPGDLKPKYSGICRTVRIAGGAFFLTSTACLFNANTLEAADLNPETLKAWRQYVQAAEQRISGELVSTKGFLALDFQAARDAERERRALFSGEITVRPMSVRNESTQRISIPEGMVHHWRGSVFIPGATLEHVLSRVENPTPAETRQEDVLDSRILERSPGRLRLYLKLQRSKIVTIVYNTEHLVEYRRYEPDKASSSSIATKIAEIEYLDGKKEREKPEGHDRGFLWRLNSYWRYVEVKGGVIVECESISLSRSIPPVLEVLVRPLINRVAKESMERTLQSMRTRIGKGVASWQKLS